MNDDFTDPEEEKVKEEPTLTMNAVITSIDLAGEKPVIYLRSKQSNLSLMANLLPSTIETACGLLGVSIKATLTPATGTPLFTLTYIDQAPPPKAVGGSAGCDPHADFGKS